MIGMRALGLNDKLNTRHALPRSEGLNSWEALHPLNCVKRWQCIHSQGMAHQLSEKSVFLMLAHWHSVRKGSINGKGAFCRLMYQRRGKSIT